MWSLEISRFFFASLEGYARSGADEALHGTLSSDLVDVSVGWVSVSLLWHLAVEAETESKMSQLLLPTDGFHSTIKSQVVSFTNNSSSPRNTQVRLGIVGVLISLSLDSTCLFPQILCKYAKEGKGDRNNKSTITSWKRTLNTFNAQIEIFQGRCFRVFQIAIWLCILVVSPYFGQKLDFRNSVQCHINYSQTELDQLHTCTEHKEQNSHSLCCSMFGIWFKNASVEDARASLFGLFHRRQVRTPSLLDLRFNEEDMLKLSSVKLL